MRQIKTNSWLHGLCLSASNGLYRDYLQRAASRPAVAHAPRGFAELLANFDRSSPSAADAFRPSGGNRSSVVKENSEREKLNLDRRRRNFGIKSEIYYMEYGLKPLFHFCRLDIVQNDWLCPFNRHQLTQKWQSGKIPQGNWRETFGGKGIFIIIRLSFLGRRRSMTVAPALSVKIHIPDTNL